MTVLALVTGSIFRAPEQRVAKSGRPFVSATVRVKDADGSMFASVVAFGDTAQSELMRLGEVAVQGPLKVETYTASSGDTKLSLSIVAEQILPLKQ
jgi:single-stranded DNA-binding protein